MAIANADGSIVLSTKVDIKGLKKDLKGITKKAGKALLSIGALAGAATVAITKMAVSAYADYEQLVGGVETLFKGSADKVKAYASDAFFTTGMSANEYMQNVTSFSASLISSLAGDTEKAADVANMALIDISDNANKMGSSLESVTLAYQGFAKGQYMLLDNLKLGYGGTKTEMERLLKDAEAYLATQGKTAKFSLDNLADVYTAINAIQQKLDIAGTTAKEAEKTIAGSANMTKAAWQDTLTALAGGGDIDRAMNNLVYSITKYMQNIVPVIKVILTNISVLLKSAVPVLMQAIVEAVVTSIPILINAVYNMVLGVFSGLVSGIKALFTGGTKEASKQLVNSTEEMTSNIGGAVQNQEELTDAVKETNKQLNKSLASFDELNTISQDTGSGAGSSSGGGSTVGVGGGTVGGTPFGTDGGEKAKSEVDATIVKIMGVVGVGLVAIGLLLCATGHLDWGIGFIVAGAGLLGITLSTLKSDAISQEVKDALSNVLIITGIVAVIIGILCCVAQKWFIGVGLIVSGIATMGFAIGLNWQGIKKQLQGVFGGVLAIVGIVAIVLGILCCFAQKWIIGIGLLVLGVGALGITIGVNFDTIKSVLQEHLGKILAITGIVAIIVGVLCCFAQKWIVGIGLIVLGTSVLGITAVLNWDSIKTMLQGKLGVALAIVGIVAVVIGILCCFAQKWIVGIGLVILGASVLGITAVINWENIKTQLQGKLGTALAIVGIVAIIIGVLCCFAQKWIIGVGLVILGASALGITAVINWENIKTQLQGKLGVALAVVGVVAIIIGILCCFAGNFILGIGLIVLGTGALGITATLNWDSIKLALQGPLGRVIAVVGIVAIVLGILICFTGNFALGIGLIVAGGLAVGSMAFLNWDTILEKLKGVWQTIQTWWNTSVAKYFTAEWWGNLAKNAINGFLRWIVNGLNTLVDKINTVGFNLPGNLGFSIPRLSVPQLAKGAVIPGGKPFLATLGDQPSGQTNIEAPLDTIVEAVKIAFGGSNGFSGRVEVPVYLDSRQIAIAIRDAENNLGVQTVTGGFANAY